MNIKKLGEFELIDWIRRRAPTNETVVLGIGDDCAILNTQNNNKLVVTTDMLMDGRHFILDQAGAAAVGRKALGVSLSDIAAMAAEPLAAFVAVALPKTNAEAIARELFEGMDPLAKRFNVAIAGGDTNVWNGPLVVCVTILGELSPLGPACRSDAMPGDVVFVTGPLGGASLGRHLDPNPRIDEAWFLIGNCKIHSMIDISDGLLADLGHILAESGGLGATLDVQSIPIHKDAEILSKRDGVSPLEHALRDGEDFELCFTVSAEVARSLLDRFPAEASLFRIGTIEDRPGLRLRDDQGTERAVDPKGFDHFFM